MSKKNLETLEAALKFEEDKRAFFLTAGEKTKEKFGKSTFLSLADAEPDQKVSLGWSIEIQAWERKDYEILKEGESIWRRTPKVRL